MTHRHSIGPGAASRFRFMTKLEFFTCGSEKTLARGKDCPLCRGGAPLTERHGVSAEKEIAPGVYCAAKARSEGRLPHGQLYSI